MHYTLVLLAGFRLTVTVFLTIVPFIYAIPNPSQPPQRGVHFRDSVAQKRDLPEGWSPLGCYTHHPNRPTLTSSYFTSTSMTVDVCVITCNIRGNVYAGLENGQDCYCGNVLTINATSALPSDCNSQCYGNSNEICGGTNRLSIYSSWTGTTPPPQPTIVPNVGSWILMGCYSDSNEGRTLAARVHTYSSHFEITGNYNTTAESCAGACEVAGYTRAGLEFANECWCGNTIENDALELDTSYCMLACDGNSSEICGGSHSLVIYKR